MTAEGAYEPAVSKVLFNNRNLELLTYENPDGTHTKLLESLKDLNQLVEEARVTIRNNQTW